MTSVARPPIAYRVPTVRDFRHRHRTTELTVHKISPGGAETADECAGFFLSKPEGVATTTISGSWKNKLPVFYGWARETGCPTCGVAPGAFCLSETNRRRMVPHARRPGIIPDPHLHKATVPYHFMIEPDGGIFQYLPIAARGAHARRSNGRSIAIACVGDYDKRRPRAAMLNSLRWLVKWLALDDQIGFVTRQDQGLLVVRGHDEVRDQPKGCPGRYLIGEVANMNPWLEGVRRQLAFEPGAR
jgi:hypothetical protein